MSMDISVHDYIARQPRLDGRRRWMYRLLKPIAFGLLWDVTVTGAEHVPAAGPAIVMMNHISTIDPILAIGAITNRFLIPMSKVENMGNPFFRTLIQGWGAYLVRRGEVDRKALLNSIELLTSGQLILIAPEGTRSPDGLREAKDGVTFIATKANAAIVPMGIGGEAPLWSAKFKRFQRPRIRINIGRAFRFNTGDGRTPRETLAQMTNEAMYQLALALPDAHLRGAYSDVSKATTRTLTFL